MVTSQLILDDTGFVSDHVSGSLSRLLLDLDQPDRRGDVSRRCESLVRLLSQLSGI